MNNKSLLKFVLLALGLFILAFAWMRIISYSPSKGDKGGFFSLSSSDKHKEKPLSESQQLTEIKRLKTQEIWENDKGTPSIPAEKNEPSDTASLLKSARSFAFPNFVPRTLEASALQNTAVAGDKSAFVPMSPTSAEHLAGRPNTALDNAASAADTAYSASPRTDNGPSNSGFGTDRQAEDKRAEMLSDYLKPNREIDAKLNRTLSTLANNIQDAVAKALMPKSKKAQNIEKYRHKTQGTSAVSASDSPFSNMMAQVSSQTNALVQNVTKAFGNKAGNEMASLVGQFQQELNSAINTPGATNAQIASKVQEISQKYQGKINKLAEKQQYDKFVEDRTEHDNQQKQELSKFYKGELLEELGGILDKARESELALASKNLPEKEYWEEVYKSNYQKQVDMREAIKKAGQPLDKFYAWLDEKERQNIEKALEAEQNGEIASFDRVETEDERIAKQKTLKEERERIIDQVTKTYGPEAAAAIKKIHENYAKDVEKEGQKSMSDAAHRSVDMKLRQNYNKQMADALKTPEMRKSAVKKQTEDIFQSIYEQNPSINSDPQLKMQYEEQTRPVIEQAVSKIMSINDNDKLTPEQKLAQTNQIRRNLEKFLSGEQPEEDTSGYY